MTWETGPLGVVADQFADKTKNLPFAAANFVDEALDHGSELLARTAFAWAWREMKQNGVAASEPLGALPANDADWRDKPGGTLLALQLRRQKDANPNLRVHVVGHSAGAVLHGAFVPRLIDKGGEGRVADLPGTGSYAMRSRQRTARSSCRARCCRTSRAATPIRTAASTTTSRR